MSKKTNRRYSQGAVDRAYERYKERIDAVTDESKNAKLAFQTEVRHLMKYKDLTTTQAIKMVIRSESYTPYEERAARNLLSGLRKDINAYADWRRLTAHKKIDYNNFTYLGYDDDGEKKIYSYKNYRGKQILIFIDESPDMDGEPKFSVVRDYDE